MSKNKQLSFIIIVSVFIAALCGFITTFMNPKAEESDAILTSYYSDENGEKTNKTEYTATDSIYSTIELKFPSNCKDLSKISLFDDEKFGIQMILKKVIDEDGKDITDKFGYENLKSKVGIYSNDPILDEETFYQHTYKFIFEEYVSDINLLDENAVNNIYTLSHNYKVSFYDKTSENNEITYPSKEISTSIKIRDKEDISVINVDETANVDSFKPGDTITYSIKLSQETETKKAIDLTMNMSGFGIYDKNSVSVKDSTNRDVLFEASQNTKNDINIIIKEDVVYGNPYTVTFKVNVPSDIKSKDGFKGILSNHLDIVGYGKTSTDNDFVLNMENNTGSGYTMDFKSDKNNYDFDNIGTYTISLKNEDKNISGYFENGKINVKFNNELSTDNYKITNVSINNYDYTEKEYTIEKNNDGFIINLPSYKINGSFDLNITYTISFKDELLSDSTFECTATISGKSIDPYTMSTSVKINKKDTLEIPDDKPDYVEKSNYNIQLTTDKDSYKNGESMNCKLVIENKNEKTPENYRVKISHFGNYQISNVLFNNQVLGKDDYTITEEDGYLIFKLNNKDFIENDSIEIDYTIEIKDVETNTISLTAEALSDNLASYKFIKMVNINTKTTNNDDKNSENKNNNSEIKDDKNSENNISNNNQNGTNTFEQNNQNDSQNVKTTQTGDTNLPMMIVSGIILFACGLYIINFIRKKDN